MSSNNVHDTIPYQLPPNLTYLNFAGNSLSGNIPYSLSAMVSLNYLNLSHNSLTQSIGEVFANLKDLSDLDFSFNNLNGDLPNSFGSLTNLSSLYLQNNQLTGQLNVLANLDLTNLDISNNDFSGWIPQQFKSIPNLQIGGNSFSNGPAPPPPPYTPPPPGRPHHNHNQSQAPTNTPQGSGGQASDLNGGSKKRHLSTSSIIGIVIGSIVAILCAALVAIFCLRNVAKAKGENQENSKEPLGSLSIGAEKGGWHQFSDYISSNAPTEWSCRVKEPLSSNGQSSSTHQIGATYKEMHEQKPDGNFSVAHLKAPPSDKVILEEEHCRSGSLGRSKVPIIATSYSVSSLQVATNSFSQDSIIGEGSLGRVYRAEFSDGQVLAVKKIDSAVVSLHEEDDFLEAISNISRLRHPNISALVGYCVEYGQRLLVYEHIGNGSLHEMLHLDVDSSRKFTWNARVRVALGTARALEYLHEVCLPSVVHRNLKSTNILLDEEFNPRISDSGLAALNSKSEKHLSPENVGSFGYSAPEFDMSGIYTVKSDVYSFGVVMLEILTGRKPLDSSRIRSEQSLVRWATPQLHDIDALDKMVDPELHGIYPAKSLSRFADIISLCIQTEPEFRPPMSEVVQALLRMMQRVSMVKRSSEDELGFSYEIPEHEETMDISFQHK